MYLESNHTQKASPDTLKLYTDLKEKIIELGDVETVIANHDKKTDSGRFRILICLCYEDF